MIYLVEDVDWPPIRPSIAAAAVTQVGCFDKRRSRPRTCYLHGEEYVGEMRCRAGRLIDALAWTGGSNNQYFGEKIALTCFFRRIPPYVKYCGRLSFDMHGEEKRADGMSPEFPL